jgi:aryl-alcohol dehydrogenase-like predicted oxidoreductase
MEYRQFGRLGWSVSEIGFGAWAIGGNMWGPQEDDESVAALHTALDRGVNFIDTAQGYGNGHSEEIIGRVLKHRSEEIYVATKVPPQKGPWPPPQDADAKDLFPKEYIIGELEKSLRRLGRDYVDVYQFHTWASAFNLQDEWFEAMDILRGQGKIRAVGVSVPDTTPENVIGALVQRRVESVQVIYNIFEQFPEENLFPVAEALGVGIIVRVPFDEGALTGKFTYDTTFPDGDVRQHYFRGNNLTAVVDRVNEIEQYKNLRHPEMTMAEYALRFCLSHKAVHTVIPGMRNPQQARWNTGAGDGHGLPAHEVNGLRKFAWRKDFWHNEIDAIEP